MNSTGNLSQDQVREALDSLTTQLAGVTIAVNNLKAILLPDDSPADDFKTDDPANKGDDGKLTARGIEICYRLFDRGENRNQVASKMKISFTAATHRYHAWQKLGGPQREKQRFE
jgi:DNA-binding NarL/FixJ family response regulator